MLRAAALVARRVRCRAPGEDQR